MSLEAEAHECLHRLVAHVLTAAPPLPCPASLQSAIKSKERKAAYAATLQATLAQLNTEIQSKTARLEVLRLQQGSLAQYHLDADNQVGDVGDGHGQRNKLNKF